MSFPAYEEYKDSGVEWLEAVPSHWTPMKLKYLFRYCKRQHHPDETVLSVYRDFGVIVKSTRDDNFNKTPIDLTSYQLVEPGDLVINKMKAWQGSLGVSQLRGITSPDYVVYNSINDEYLPFLHYLLRSKPMAQLYHSLSNGVRLAQWRVETDKFEQIELYRPPLPEQTAIASFLDTETSKIDSLVSEQRRLIELLKEKRQAVISHAVTKGLNPDVPMKDSDIEWLGEVPEGWEVKRYKHVLRIQQGMAFKSSDYVGKSRVISVRMGNIKKGGLIDLLHNAKYLPDSFATEYADYQLHEGDLLIAMTDMSPSLEFLAVPAFMKNLENDSVYLLNQRVGKVTVSDSCDSGYLKYLLLSESLRKQLKATGLGTVQANMSNGDLYSTSLAIPPTKQKQAEIASYLDDVTLNLDHLIAQAERAIELLQERRTALISAAVTGKIDVREFACQEVA
jgi:type I restriction enzyme S subunit